MVETAAFLAAFPALRPPSQPHAMVPRCPEVPLPYRCHLGGRSSRPMPWSTPWPWLALRSPRSMAASPAVPSLAFAFAHKTSACTANSHSSASRCASKTPAWHASLRRAVLGTCPRSATPSWCCGPRPAGPPLRPPACSSSPLPLLPTGKGPTGRHPKHSRYHGYPRQPLPRLRPTARPATAGHVSQHGQVPHRRHVVPCRLAPECIDSR